MRSIFAILGLIPILVWVVIISAVIKAAKKNKGNPGAGVRQQPFGLSGGVRTKSASSHPARLQDTTKLDRIKYQSSGESRREGSYDDSGRPRKEQAAVDETRYTVRARRGEKENYAAESSVLKEDRKNDWMARQLAEEARAKRRSTIDLGAAHESSCAADELKASHHHDYGFDAIDTPEKNALPGWRSKGTVSGRLH